MPTDLPMPALTTNDGAPNAGERASDRVFASPLARRIAARQGLDLKAIRGTGPNGRIVKADLHGTGRQVSAAPAPPAAERVEAGSELERTRRIYAEREFEEIPLDSMRKSVAARLSDAKRSVPHFYLRRDIRIDLLLLVREQLNAEFADRGYRLTINDFIIKAVALALQQVPECNVVWAGERILRLQASDIAVAVAVQQGVFTPVLRDADKKSLAALSQEMTEFVTRARARSLAPSACAGGSITVSNLGMMGIESFQAVITPPHAAILAVGAAVRRPVVSEVGQIEAATMMSATLSVDHRVIDGALGARFLEAIRKNLERPLGMLV